MAAVGNIALIFAIITMIYSIIVGVVGRQQDSWNLRASAQGAASAAFFLVLAASIVLWHALMTNDFSLVYVANYSKLELPWYFKFSAFWAGQAGSLLFWILVSAALPPFVLRSKLPDKIAFFSSSLITGLNLAFLLILMTTSPPFRTLAQVPADGSGLNPMLQSFGMIVHPPVTFLAFALFSVPWAIICASLWQSSTQPWHQWIRPWMLGAWTALTFGIISGGQWAYTELGWGGYWAWDPVENASLFPWLTATAMLHTLSLQRRGFGFGRWNASLACVNLLLCIFGTFLTRSGILDSVHAFSDSRVGQAFMIVLVTVTLFSVLSLIRGAYDKGRSPKSTFSFYGVFLLLTVFLVLMTIGVFVGTMMPYFSGLVGRSVVFQESFYNQLTIPFWLALTALLGATAIMRWQDPPKRPWLLGFGAVCAIVLGIVLSVLGMSSPLALISLVILAFAAVGISVDMWKRSAHRSAHIVHIGLLCIALGITGSLFNEEKLQPVLPGETMTIGNYELIYPGLENRTRGMYTTVTTTLDILRDGEKLGVVSSSKTFHPTYRQPSTDIGVFGSWREDIYFNLSGWDHDEAYLQVSVKPLVAWIWLGSYLMYLGGLWLLWRNRRIPTLSQN